MSAKALSPTPDPQVARSRGKPLEVVVGYDGSEPSRRALDKAADLLNDRDGILEVVFVFAAPASAGFSGMALGEVLRGAEEEAAALAAEVSSRLEGRGVTWHFQRRNGAVANEVLATAKDLHDRYGDTVDFVIVVGGSAHKYHQLIGSVGSSVVRSHRFPVLVVP